MEGAKRKNEKYLPSPLTTSRHRAPSVLSYLHDDTPQKKKMMIPHQYQYQLICLMHIMI